MIAKLEPLLASVVANCGAELYELEYVKEGGERILRLSIDKPGGVGLDDCEAVSRAVESVLDEHDPIPTAYRLQVGSPGIERRLSKPEHFTRYVGHKVMVKLFAPHSPDDRTQAESVTTGRKKFSGVLTGFAEGILSLTDADNQEWYFKIEQVSACRLVYEPFQA